MKKFGQHFLINEGICDQICDLIDLKDCNVLEVGPGKGILTKCILKYQPKKLLAIEIDKNLNYYLSAIAETHTNFHYIIDDIKKYSLENISTDYFEGEKFVIVANLPYNIGTRLLVSWYSTMSNYCNAVVLMLQEEVVDRICSLPNNKEYGRLSVLSQYVMQVNKSFIVDRNQFHKPPKVNSAIIKGVAREINIKTYHMLYEIVTLAFHSRRKILKNKLCSLKGVEHVLNKRAEDLSLNDYLKIVENNI